MEIPIANPATLSVCMVALDRMIGTSISLPAEMLSAAKTIGDSLNASYPNLTLVTASHDSAPLTLSGGLRLLPDCSYLDIEHCNLIILPALWRNPRPLLQRYPDLIAWLRQRYQDGALICAAGTGVYLMAGAGLLDGKPATTHWHYLDQFEHLFPRVILKRHHLITQSGQLYCAGSVNSVADLMVHLISHFFDDTVAARVERQFSPEIRRPLNDVFYSFEQDSAHEDETIITIQQWLHEHLGEVVNMRELAAYFSLSQRSLNRRFKEATGVTPLEYLNNLRLAAARDLLKTTNLSITEVALHTGFQDTGYFCRLFKQKIQVTPSDYRLSVRGKLFKL